MATDAMYDLGGPLLHSHEASLLGQREGSNGGVPYHVRDWIEHGQAVVNTRQNLQDETQAAHARQQQPSQPESVKAHDPVAPAPMRSPDLTAVNIPRPNQRYTGSIRGALSISSVGNNDATDLTTTGPGAPGTPSDIRNKIAPKHRLKAVGNKWVKNTWEDKNPDAAFVDPVYVNPWIEDYVAHQIDYDVRANFLHECNSANHCHCDVDTFTGKLLKPVEYPYSVPDYFNGDSTERQMNRTASLYVKKLTSKGQKKESTRPYRPPADWVDTPLSTSVREPSVKKLHQSTQVKVKETDSEADPFAPLISCHVRPAGREHMPGVQEIYNLEVLNGLQALDTEPLPLSDFEAILSQTQRAKMPFVVALSGPFEPFASGAKTEMTQKNGRGMVLAFAFLTIRQPGLAGSFSGTSRMSAKAHVFVHPDYRRKRLGHICLDKILSTVSTRYSTKLGYEFINPDDNPTYKYPWQHDRTFYSIYIEYFVPLKQVQTSAFNPKFAPDNTDLEWFEELMISRYGFRKEARLDATHRSRRSYQPNPIWLDTVIFEHICQEGLWFTETL